MAEFKAIAFNERADSGARFPVFGSTAAATIIRPARGSRVIIQTRGQKESRLALPITCTGAQLVSLDAAVGTTGTLYYGGGTRNAFLEGVADPQRVGIGDLFFATLSFIGM